MTKVPSDRNLQIFAYREAGHTLRETAERFGLSPQTIRTIEWRTRDYQEAAEALKKEPSSIMLLARTAQLNRSAANALHYGEGIERLEQLKGYSFWDLTRIPNMGRVGAEQIVRLAASLGIHILPPEPTEASHARAKKRQAAMSVRVRDDGEPGVSYEAWVRLAEEPSYSWFFISAEIVRFIAPQVAEHGAELAWARTHPELLHGAAVNALQRHIRGDGEPTDGGPFKVKLVDLPTARSAPERGTV